MTTGICPQGHLVTRRSPLVGAMMGPAFASGCEWMASVDDPAMAGPLGDIWIAAPEAKVTFIEYAAVTCTHCAAVHNEVWPGIKARWIDTGRTRFALRGYPLTPLDTAAFMLARADGGRTYCPITDLLFERQRFWTFVDKPLDAMRDLLRQAGFHRARFDAVLAGAMKVLNVHTTPILYLNGDRHEGALPADAFDAIARKRSG